jgi:hypothetical protein
MKEARIQSDEAKMPAAKDSVETIKTKEKTADKTNIILNTPQILLIPSISRSKL